MVEDGNPVPVCNVRAAANSVSGGLDHSYAGMARSISWTSATVS
jgi:hypothetical protein